MKKSLLIRKWKSFSLLAMLLACSVWIILYEIPPSTIQIRQVQIDEGEFEVRGIAQDLIVQGVTEQGIWASRGNDIYLKPREENSFQRIGRVPIPSGLSYLSNIRILRHLLNKQEVLELLILSDGNIIAFGGGHIFHSSDRAKNFTRVASIAHFGLTEGRGLMPHGYTADAKGNIYWGEYWRNPERQAIRIMKSADGGSSWEPVYTFQDGEIRHIHSVEYDPYFDAIWVATGDKNSESNIMYSTDEGRSFTKIGSGSQKWRAVSLLFQKDKVYWGMDGTSPEFPELHIWSWDRVTGKTEKVSNLDSYAFYSAILKNGNLILSQDGSVTGNAGLWTSRDGNKWQKVSNWSRVRKNHYGTIRMKVDNNDLIISNMNLSYHNNDLLILNLH